MPKETLPLYYINSVAPIRICDNGGWTDTWFAEHGKVFNIAVSPYVEVQIAVFPDSHEDGQVVINAVNFGDRYLFNHGTRNSGGGWIRHPLLEATIEYMRIPKETHLEITIYSQAPSGASTGTSAAVTVALIGALDYLTPGCMTPHEVAYAAHKVETEILSQQSGIQDQICCAYGGVNYIEMDSFPNAKVSKIKLPDATWWELERRLVLIYLGKSHRSSDVHKKVIRSLEDAGPDCKQLEDLRNTAPRSRDALMEGDFRALGKAMFDNTEAQRRLHPELVSADASRLIEIAREYKSLGWKVNGAGGEGGSLTILCCTNTDVKRAMIQEIDLEYPDFKNIPISLSRDGLQVWTSK
jgi:D-glycero-alpha-D-manno-heptose-7-phosphate kinase